MDSCRKHYYPDFLKFFWSESELRAIGYKVQSTVEKIANSTAGQCESSQIYGPKAIILVPTVQLADQIAKQANDLANSLGITAKVISGQSELEHQLRTFQEIEKPDILIGTVGRMMFCLGIGDNTSLLGLKRLKAINTSHLTTLVADEVDMMMGVQMFDGFSKIVRKITNLSKVQSIQSIFLSATISDQLKQKLTHLTLKKNLLVFSLNDNFQIPSGIVQIAYDVSLQRKYSLLKYLILRKGNVSLKNKKVLVFARTIQKVTRICENLKTDNIRSLCLHSELSPSEKTLVASTFNSTQILNKSDIGQESGSPMILVATDFASRGLDFSNVQVVVNFDIPTNPIDYLHRVGRTGRMGQPGMAISFVGSSTQEINLGDTRIATRDEKVYMQRIDSFFSKHQASKSKIEYRKIPGPFKDTTKYSLIKDTQTKNDSTRLLKQNSISSGKNRGVKKLSLKPNVALDPNSPHTVGIWTNTISKTYPKPKEILEKKSLSRTQIDNKENEDKHRLTYERAINEFQKKTSGPVSKK
ncbi:ATP-dependent RNA helicase RhlE [Smittium mucronatum]|uniref:RNA helicase n=1 Tax=Smittium mucronatum TaxID=133383 RepID=A0A1R0H699_9FUNG|nr:ATP-dependent RNA helicase RhlE [Smittium mucronatum]